ncbi:unnamed protein product, partial [Mesorhabditis spiculigera]
MMDVPPEVLHRILDKLPIKNVLKLRPVHRAFNNYFRHVRKTCDFFAVTLSRPGEQSPTVLKFERRGRTWDQFVKIFGTNRHLDVEVLMLSTVGSCALDLGELGPLAATGRLRGRIVQICEAKIDEPSRAFIKNVRPEIIHVSQLSGREDSWVPVPSTCTKITVYWAAAWGPPTQGGRIQQGFYNTVIDLTEATSLTEVFINRVEERVLTSEAAKITLNKLRTGTETKATIDALIAELNSGPRDRDTWQYEFANNRHYINHPNVSFFINKPTES